MPIILCNDSPPTKKIRNFSFGGHIAGFVTVIAYTSLVYSTGLHLSAASGYVLPGRLESNGCYHLRGSFRSCLVSQSHLYATVRSVSVIRLPFLKLGIFLRGTCSKE